MNNESTLDANTVIDEPNNEPKENTLNLDDLSAGYIVGLTKDGNFVFQILGEKKGLVELLGMNAHANSRVKQIYDRSQVTGDILIHEVGKGLSILNQKLDQVLNVVAPKKPDNDLG